MTLPARGTPASAFIDVFLVAAEESGDRLGAALIRALRERSGERVRFTGVGGREMATEGVASLYAIDDLPLIGFSAIPRRLPRILRDRKSTRLNSSHFVPSRMPSSACEIGRASCRERVFRTV